MVDQDFRGAMQAAGLNPPEHIEPGRVQRFPGAGKGKSNRSGWGFLFTDGQGGAYGDYSTGLSGTWQAKRERPFSSQEKEAFRKQIEESKRQAEEQRLQDQQKAAARVAPIMEAATGDPATHPYSVQKNQLPNGRIKRGSWPQRRWDDALLIPMIDEFGKTCSVQAINTDSSKDFLRGGKKKGCFRPLGKFRGATGPVLIGEGLATVAAAVEATGFPGVVAFDAGNLIHVAEVVRRLNPFSFFKGDKESKLGTNSLSFVGKVGKGKNRRLSYWKVKSTGNYGTDLKIGQSYAFEALRVARAQESAGCISLIMQSFPKGEKMTGIEQGFIKVIADCTMAGTMWLAEKSTL